MFINALNLASFSAFTDAYAADDAITQGTIADSCAPWDGPAFRIDLDDGLSVSVFTNLSAFEGNAEAVTFSAEPYKMENGAANIVFCEEPGKNCKQYSGSVSIFGLTSDEASGVIEMTGEQNVTTKRIFRVKRISTQAVCG